MGQLQTKDKKIKHGNGVFSSYANFKLIKSS